MKPKIVSLAPRDAGPRPAEAEPRARPPAWDGRPIRPTVATVDLGALAHNFRSLRALAGDAGVLAVVKADAYGHGAVACARVLDREGAAFLGVALAEEGLELRAAGLATPTLVLGGAYGDRYDLLVAYDLVPVVFRTEHLAGLAAAARAQGRSPEAHLKLDTGMGRIGVLPLDLGAFADAATANGVALTGLASHFANADLADDELTARQEQLFDDALAALRAKGHPVRHVHLANSAAAVERPRSRGTLVRPGVMLYGLVPSERFARTPGEARRAEPTKGASSPREARSGNQAPACGGPIAGHALTGAAALRPVLRWTTEISHLKDVPFGAPVSYGGRWVARRSSRIATIPVGYADGYERHLGNVGQVLVRGRRARVAGAVCMDQTMLDVTDVPGVAVGDEVTLVGRQGAEEITAGELAGWCGTIHYETLCGIGRRVPRRTVGG